jgi:hypothetical protein
MSTARIIAQLVEAGHEDLADELLSESAVINLRGVRSFEEALKRVQSGLYTSSLQIDKGLFAVADARDLLDHVMSKVLVKDHPALGRLKKAKKFLTDYPKAEKQMRNVLGLIDTIVNDELPQAIDDVKGILKVESPGTHSFR